MFKNRCDRLQKIIFKFWNIQSLHYFLHLVRTWVVGCSRSFPAGFPAPKKCSCWAPPGRRLGPPASAAGAVRCSQVSGGRRRARCGRRAENARSGARTSTTFNKVHTLRELHKKGQERNSLINYLTFHAQETNNIA